MFALIRFELRKLTAQKRSLAGFGAVIFINLLFVCAFILRNRKFGHKPVPGVEDRLIGEFINAYVYTQTILAPSMFVLFPMVLTIIGCHLLAGEIELGQTRLMACRSVSRWQIVLAKFVSLSAYSGLLLLVLLVSSYATSAILFEPSGDLVTPGRMYMIKEGVFIHPQSDALWRILTSYLFAWPMLMSIGALALMMSLVTRQFTSSAILTSTSYFCSYIVGGIPFLSSIHPFLPTRYLPFWRLLMYPDVPWDRVLTYALWTGGYTALFLIVGIAVFNTQEL
jgi:ABC-2 type transport system permease protein